MIPPPGAPGRPDNGVTLAKWSDCPLDPENSLAFLSRKTLVCYVGDPPQMTAMLVFPQGEMRYLRPGQRATLTLNSHRGHRFSGTVGSVSNQRLETLPRELSASNGGPIATSAESAAPASDPSAKEIPMLPTFEASVEPGDYGPLQLLPGMKGKAKIRVGDSPLGERLYRYVVTMFRF